MPPPPSRPRYNSNINDIETNQIPNDKEQLPSPTNNGVIASVKNDYQNNPNGFFVDVPPKFYKSSPAKQQFYQQQYLNDLFSKNYYSKSNKYNVIAFKDKYRNIPYYVVSAWIEDSVVQTIYFCLHFAFSWFCLHNRMKMSFNFCHDSTINHKHDFDIMQNK